MRKLKTWSNGNTYFEYEGSVETGTKIYYGADFAFKSIVSKEQYQLLIDEFNGKTVFMGTSRSSPQSGSVGEWLTANVKGPSIGSYVGVILVHEGYAQKDGSEIIFNSFNSEKIKIDRDESLKFEIAKLARLQIKLEEKGGLTKDGDLFEEILEIESEILTRFGLPENSDYNNLIYFEILPSELEILDIIFKLHEAAENYLLDDPISDIQILKNAQEYNQDVSSVLAELKVKNHTYTHFVFDEILLKKKDTVENVLHELKLTKDIDILTALGNVGYIEGETLKEMTQLLKDVGIKYIDLYIASTNFLE
jgi:hypothetical protein